MGYRFPMYPQESPADQARVHMARKDAIEAELDAQFSILRANSSTMESPLLDASGFPRADIDVWAVRVARVRVIELRNDLKATMDAIYAALQNVYDPNTIQGTSESQDQSAKTDAPSDRRLPFAKVNAVAPGSPAASAGLLREDLIVAFGPLKRDSFTGSSLQPLAELVAEHENRQLAVDVLRGSNNLVSLRFTPRSGWGGRGLLGCHIVPYIPT
ncbi:hypothetical protein B0H21DRAFT_737883 [Amylocystis lapponica]|nr:hypothetical protein B0H21DRAFT_737883 [Amylocystis lapponica]